MTKQTNWSRIILIAGSLIVLVCCLALGAFLLVSRMINTAADEVASRNTLNVRSLAWSPDGSQLAVGSADHTITIWDVKSGKLLLTITDHVKSIRELAWSPDGRILAAGDQGGAIYLWDPLTGKLIEQVAKENELDALGYLDWSPNGYFLTYTGNRNYINGWNVDRREKTVFAQSQSGITGISWSPDDTKLANSSTGGKVTVWDRQTGKSIWVIDAHTGWANDVDWALDGSLLASGGDDGELKIWDPKTGKLVSHSTGTIRVFGVAFSPAVVSQVAWGSGAGEVIITESDVPDRRLKAGSGQVWVVAWSRDGKQLAAGTEGNTVFVWDAATDQQIQLLTVPTH